jgi:hypothetical protein
MFYLLQAKGWLYTLPKRTSGAFLSAAQVPCARHGLKTTGENQEVHQQNIEYDTTQTLHS